MSDANGFGPDETYIPSTEEVRGWITAHGYETDDGIDWSKYGSAFDRWFAREVAAAKAEKSSLNWDYMPSWDDRKTLLEVWQEHAPLPDIGLREGIFQALLAVADWGYFASRKDEGWFDPAPTRAAGTETGAGSE